MKEENPKLLPCPFCGGEAAFYTSYDNGTGYDIGCDTDTCIMRSGSDIQYGTMESAAKEWNSRIQPPMQAIKDARDCMRYMTQYEEGERREEDICKIDGHTFEARRRQIKLIDDFLANPPIK